MLSDMLFQALPFLWLFFLPDTAVAVHKAPMDADRDETSAEVAHIMEVLEVARDLSADSFAQQSRGKTPADESISTDPDELIASMGWETRTHTGGYTPEGLSAEELEDLCDPSHALSFQGSSSVVYSNLRGNGPNNTGGVPFGLVISDVFPTAHQMGGNTMDLKITALGQYFPHDANKNWVNGPFLNINLESGSTVEFLLQFNAHHSEARTPSFFFTVLDLDHQPNGEGIEGVAVRGYDKFVLPKESAINVTQGEDGSMTFWSTISGISSDNPKHSMGMAEMAKRKAVTFVMPSLQNFSLILRTTEGWSGRNFLLTGATNVVCAPRMSCHNWLCPAGHMHRSMTRTTTCKTATCNVHDDLETCCEPDPGVVRMVANATDDLFPEHSLLESSLGSTVEDAKMIFGDVFPNSTEGITDLVVTPGEGFISENPAANAQNRTSLEVNLKCGSTAQLVFTFRERGSGQPREVRNFLFVVHGLSVWKPGEGIESVVIHDVLSYNASQNESSIIIHPGHVSGGRYSSVKLIANTDAQHGHPVEFEMKSTSNFSLNLAVSTGCPGGRKFTFSGRALANLGRAPCSTMTCPVNFVSKPEVETLFCAESKCKDEDVDICCEMWEPEWCQPKHSMVFMPGSLVHSNLGGIGPHKSSAEETMVLADVFPESSRTIDLELRALSNYSAYNPLHNEITGAFLNLNVMCGTHVDINFRFYERNHPDREVVLDGFFMSIFDFDTEAEGHGLESVKITDPNETTVSNNTNVKIEHLNDKFGKRMKITATVEGESSDNPIMPSDMMASEENKAVSMLWRNASEFVVTLGATPCSHQGRNFLLAGSSNLVCPAKEPCNKMKCPVGYVFRTDYGSRRCTSSTCGADDICRCCMQVFVDECMDRNVMTLDESTLLHSNLGGAGPDQGEQVVRYHNVFPYLDRAIDLEVSNLTSYTVSPQFGFNGVRMGYGKVFVRTGSRVTLQFTFRDHHTNEPVRPPSFLFSFFDLDTYIDDFGATSVVVEGATESRVAVMTKLRVVGANFTGGAMHMKGSNFFDVRRGRHPRALNSSELNSTVSFLMENLSSFVAHIQVNSLMNHSEIIKMVWFGGASNLVCPEVATCSTHTCPSGMELRTRSAQLTCLGPSCTQEDTNTCCIRSPVEACDPRRILSFRNSQVTSSQLDNQEGAYMEISNVMPDSGHEIRLRISTLGTYYNDEPSANTIRGDFARLGVRKGTMAQFVFEMYQTLSTAQGMVEQPYEGGAFFFSIANFFEKVDKVGQPEGHIEVEVSGFESFNLTDTSVVRNLAGKRLDTRFLGEDQMTHNVSIHNMTSAQLDRSVSFLMKETSRWVVTVSVGAGPQDSGSTRFLTFTGALPYTCETRAPCSSYTCPHGHRFRRQAEQILCAESVCDATDLETCCVFS